MRRARLILAILPLACDSGAVSEDSGAVPVPAPGKADAVASGLPMITEYTEPTVGNDKAIELYNPLPFAVSMDDCAVEVFFNGNTAPRRIGLEGVVMQPGGTALVCHGSADAIDGCDVSTSNLSFNGNDAVALRCDFGGSQPATLDVVGVVGENPGSSGWEVPGGHTRNMTLRRACTVQTGHDRFEPDQWEAVGADDLSGLGAHVPCPGEPAPACNQGEDVLGADADAIFGGEDPRFEVVVRDAVFANFTPRTQELLLSAALRFGFPEDEITDAASAVGAIARDGTGGIERLLVRDNDTGLDYDAVRYYANDATEHSVVHLADGGDEVAYSFDGELFGCDGMFCSDGDLTLPVYEGVDEDFNPIDRFTVLEHDTVLGDGARVRRVFRRGDDLALLDLAFVSHGLGEMTSTEALEAVARDNGTVTYYFIGGPTEDLEGVVFEGAVQDLGLLVVEDSLDPELVSVDGQITFCAPPA